MRCLQIILFILCIINGEILSQSNNVGEISLTPEQSNYILNKALEFLILDSHIDFNNEGLPFNRKVVDFDSIHFFIDNERIGIVANVDDPIKLENARPLYAALNVEETAFYSMYNARIVEIESYSNLDVIRSTFSDIANFALVSFSDLYEYDGKIYIRMGIIYLLKSTLYFYPSECTFQIELCNGKIPIFRLGFFNEGHFLDGKSSTYTFTLNEKDCK